MKILCLGLCLIAFAGCAPKSDPETGATKRQFLDALFSEDTYGNHFERWTLERRILSEFEPIMTAYATYWSKEMREAFAREMAAEYRMSPDAEKILASEQLQEDESFVVFVLSVATRETEWNDLQDTKKGLWRMTLESSDGKIQSDPHHVEIVSQKNERMKHFYKHMGAFTKTYKVFFPKDLFVETKEMHFHISGPRGSLEFPFKKSS